MYYINTLEQTHSKAAVTWYMQVGKWRDNLHTKIQDGSNEYDATQGRDPVLWTMRSKTLRCHFPLIHDVWTGQYFECSWLIAVKWPHDSNFHRIDSLSISVQMFTSFKLALIMCVCMCIIIYMHVGEFLCGLNCMECITLEEYNCTCLHMELHVKTKL